MSETAKPVLEEIFEQGLFPKLLAGYCQYCERKLFPKPIICPYCLKPTQTVRLSEKGTIYSYTVIRIKAPFSLPQPYAVGYIDLKEDNLRIFSLLDSEKINGLGIGAKVELCIGKIGVDREGAPCMRYYFTPV